MRLVSQGPEHTLAIGRALGQALKPGDTVLLYGDLGAGKTTLVKGIASCFGIPSRDVTSASFTIVVHYDTRPAFYHIDLYRIEHEAALEGAGVYEAMDDTEGVCVVEWAEHLPASEREGSITINISTTSQGTREFIIDGIDETHCPDIKKEPAPRPA